MDYLRQLHRMLRPDEIQKDLDDYNRPVQNDRSVDDCLDSTDAFVQWAQRKAPQFDPENRQPIPNLNDSSLSDYDIQFTRLNKTDQGLSSLSSLNIPLASNTSLSVLSNNATPRENAISRKSSNIPRRSGHFTPSQMIQQRQSAKIDMAGRQNQFQRDSIGKNGFTPLSSSTPIRAQRKKSTIFENLAGTETSQDKLMDSASDKHDTLTNNGNTSTPKDRTYQKETHENQNDDSELTLVPAAKPADESVVPETQDCPETQEDRLPERERDNSVSNSQTSRDKHTNSRNTMTQKNRTYQMVTQTRQIGGSEPSLVHSTQSENESIIPETQDDQIPETQDERLPETERNNSITSTPTRSQRKKSSTYEQRAGAEAETTQNKLSDNASNARTLFNNHTVTINRNTLTPTNKTYRMMTPENQIDDSGPILEREAQPVNESIIPETQDDQVPETQDEPIPNTEQNDIALNARASDTHDALTNVQNTPTSIDKTNHMLTRYNAVVLLSPLSAETMRKRSRKVSVVPMDLVFTPPANFQNSRRTSQLENDDLIVEASPSTCEMRKKQLEQRNFDQPDADQSHATPKSAALAGQRKKGRKKSELAVLRSISTDSSRKSLPAKQKGRRLTSIDALRNDTDDGHDNDIEHDVVVTPATSTNNLAKSTTDDNTFKKPEIPRRKSVRKSKANNSAASKSQTNVSTASASANANPNENGKAKASTSRQISQDEFDFRIDIEPMNDDELEAYMPQNDTTLSNTLQSNEKSNEGKSKTTTTTTNADSKTKRPKRARSTDDTVVAPIVRQRRQSNDTYRDRYRDLYMSSWKSKQLGKTLKNRATAPIVHRRAESGPPKKKIRTEPEIRRKTTQPSTSKSSKTSAKSKISIKSKPNQPSTSSATATATSSSEDDFADFTVGLDEKRLCRQEFWKDINDFEKDNEIQQEDVTYIKTKDGVIEVATHKQIEYFKMDGVKYGFVPSTNKRFGLMRFPPGGKKLYEKSSGIIYLHVLQGLFELRGEDGSITLEASSETIVKKDVFYEITNKGIKTGIIHFEYTE